MEEFDEKKSYWMLWILIAGKYELCCWQISETLEDTYVRLQ